MAERAEGRRERERERYLGKYVGLPEAEEPERGLPVSLVQATENKDSWPNRMDALYQFCMVTCALRLLQM